LTNGPFTLAEARKQGMTWDQLQGASWRRLGHGLYAWAGIAEDPMLRLAAARRRLPGGAVFGGRTAAWLHGLEASLADPIEVVAPPDGRVQTRAGLAVRPDALRSNDIVIRKGMPTTSITRTLTDLSSRLPLVEVVLLVEAGLRGRRLKRSAVPARIVELADPRAESPMETRLRLLLVLAGLPTPELQRELHDEAGHFVGRADLYYPRNRLVIEYDGSVHRDSLADDDRRQNRLVGAGFRLLRFTARDVMRTPDRLVSQVRSAIARDPAAH